MKKYEVHLKFIERKKPVKYVFAETDMKNPAGEILFSGLPARGKFYHLHYTEFTLQKLNATQL